MGKKLLTIVVPTYNRADSLELLLGTLASELAGLEHLVDIIVGDNASADRTPAVTSVFHRAYLSAVILRHGENVGPDENFCRCIDRADSRFLWIIGDDDLPKTGILRKIISVLTDEKADILYLTSEWMPKITNSDCGVPVGKLSILTHSGPQFAREVNTWITFISTMIINLDTLDRRGTGLDIRRFTGTNLVQLGWVLPLLKGGTRFCTIGEKCMLAKSDNTGGYALIGVLGANFVRIISEFFSDDSVMRRAVLIPHYLGFLPYLIWHSRFKFSSSFIPEDGWSVMQKCAKRNIIFWLVLTPLFYLPNRLSFVLVRFSRLMFLIYKKFHDLNRQPRKGIWARKC